LPIRSRCRDDGAGGRWHAATTATARRRKFATDSNGRAALDVVAADHHAAERQKLAIGARSFAKSAPSSRPSNGSGASAGRQCRAGALTNVGMLWRHATDRLRHRRGTGS